MSNVTEVPNVERDKLLASIEQLKRTLPAMLEYQELAAQLTRAKYLGLIKAGFNEQQALELSR
jgi:hypothetical protein